MHTSTLKNPSESPIYAIVGPTASGKSTLALALAQRLGAEIIACDSVQIYRGFDIGSAKPTADEQARIRHHLIDIIDAETPFDAQDYCQRVDKSLSDIAHRQRHSILCGGTGLYLRALRYGLAPTVGADPTFRHHWQQQEQQVPGTLHQKLHAVDPESAARIGIYNKVQLLRALEITMKSGEPASRIRARHAFAKPVRRMRILQLIWQPDELRARIDQRIKQMLEMGFVQEVQQLLARGIAADARPMRAVGYREVVDVVQKRLAPDALHQAIFKSTWAYARRQSTWLRREADLLELPMQGNASDVERAEMLLRDL